jgi:hypothetical protein
VSELESFSSYESGNQGSDPESFRLFQERMKAAAAQIQGIRAGEQKQKKKEDELAKILGNFIKSKQGTRGNDEFLMMTSSLLALNIPAIFILSILVLNFPELQRESGIKLLSFDEAMSAGVLDAETLPDMYLGAGKLPPHIKVAIDSWIQEINKAATDGKEKIIKTAVTNLNKWESGVFDFVNFSLQHYLSANNIVMQRDIVGKFVEYFMSNILDQIVLTLRSLEAPGE